MKKKRLKVQKAEMRIEPIMDPMGQYNHPRMPTRIPSDHITMQGIPYPVMAYADNGMQVMMMPNQDYIFPGANYVDEYPMAADGININPAHKGIFTEKAKRHNMSVQEFASYVLANKDKFPSDTVKQANFARNAAKWHKQDGGEMIEYNPADTVSLKQYYNQYAMNNTKITPNQKGFEVLMADGTLRQVSRDNIGRYIKVSYRPITYQDDYGTHTVIKPNGLKETYQDGGEAIPEAYIPTVSPTMDFYGNPTQPADDEIQRKREKWKNQYYHYKPISPYNDEEKVYRTAGDFIKNLLIHGERRKRDIARTRNITRVYEDGGYIDVFRNGGYIEADLSPQEIEMLRNAGYNVEEI